METRITELREQIAALDRALLELIERRFALAAEVGRFKAERGQPVVVREVERRVLLRAREAAELCGVSPEVMEAVFAAIIRGSVERQHRVGVELRARGAARILIIGAGGSMGSWLRRFAEGIGHQVDGVDIAWAGLPPGTDHWASLDAVPDLGCYAAFFVAVPLETTAEVLADLADRQLTAPVFEIASIKSHLRESLAALRETSTPVISLHPMFGPGKSPYEPLTWVHAVLEDEAAEREIILDLLGHPYVDLISLPMERHDHLMGWLLGLAHLTGMIFAGSLTRAGLDPVELGRVASTTFARQVATARSVLQEDPMLYLEIQRLNPFRGEVYAALTAALGELTGAVERNDREGFSDAMAKATAALPTP